MCVLRTHILGTSERNGFKFDRVVLRPSISRPFFKILDSEFLSKVIGYRISDFSVLKGSFSEFKNFALELFKTAESILLG